MSQELKMCFVVPVHNEAQRLGEVVASLKRKNYDVVVIDDGSTDASAQIAKENGAYVLHNEVRTGKGMTLKKGFEYALSHGYEGVLMLDGDGQHAVDDVDKFLNLAYKDKKCIILGNRMEDTRSMPFVRYLTNRFMSALISFACRQNLPDTQCGYRYIHCDILRALNLESRNYEIETEILMKASKKGFKIYSVPIKTIYGDEESHIRPFQDSIKFVKYFSKEIFRK